MNYGSSKKRCSSLVVLFSSMVLAKKIAGCSKIDTWFQQKIPLSSPPSAGRSTADYWLQLFTKLVAASRSAGFSKRRRAVAPLEQPVLAARSAGCSTA